ncbi:AAA family ATPase [Pseudomonas alliivorans]|nr:AAA family ATPase [Pseudomonas alliivorans]
MYLSALKIQNFRQFGSESNSLVIQFNKGVTALVGENDAGKSSVIDPLADSNSESGVRACSILASSWAEDRLVLGCAQAPLYISNLTGEGYLVR